MHYRVFYCFDRCGESVSSASAMEMSARTICEQLLPRLQSEDDFLGIIDPQEQILQILCEPDAGRFWVEVPLDAAKASYGKHMDLAELREFIAHLPATFDHQAIPGLVYRPW
jgi:hypothetical protein